jgi:ABC-2 type transport system permease protein
MNLLTITFKDLRRSFRSLFAIMFMFGVPLLTTALFWLMLGGLGGDEEAGFSLPPATVQIVNRDEGQVPGTGEPLGAMLVELLQSEELSALLDVTVAPDEQQARAAVARGDAAVALVIPAGFSAALTSPDQSAVVALYQDPGLTIGPQVVAAVVRQLVDDMAAQTISIGVTLEQLHAAGVVPDEALVNEVIAFARTAEPAALNVVTPGGGIADSSSDLGAVLSLIMGGMMVFYAFFTGASSMQTILVEEEQGTLPRLFTTPTPRPVILGGKALAVVITLVVQVTVLLLLGDLVFGIEWGRGLPLALAAAGLVIVATATGVFLVSFLRNQRQAGIMFGGVLTLTGMLGLVSVFAAGAPQSATMERVSLLVPQGWAIRAFRLVEAGASGAELGPTLGALLLWSVVFGVAGLLRLRRRFA